MSCTLKWRVGVVLMSGLGTFEDIDHSYQIPTQSGRQSMTSYCLSIKTHSIKKSPNTFATPKDPITFQALYKASYPTLMSLGVLSPTTQTPHHPSNTSLSPTAPSPATSSRILQTFRTPQMLFKESGLFSRSAPAPSHLSKCT